MDLSIEPLLVPPSLIEVVTVGVLAIGVTLAVTAKGAIRDRHFRRASLLAGGVLAAASIVSLLGIVTRLDGEAGFLKPTTAMVPAPWEVVEVAMLAELTRPLAVGLLGGCGLLGAALALGGSLLLVQLPDRSLE